MSDPQSKEQQAIEDYVMRVAQYLGFTMESLPDAVRERIKQCGEHRFSAREAYYSTQRWLAGEDAQ